MKTFILCVGAEKSGTSWLYNYLCSNNNFVKGLQKEYRVIENMYNLSLLDYERMYRQSEPEFKKFYDEDRYYFDHFKELLKDKDFTGDFSPTYCTLPKEAFAKISREFRRRGIKVKVIFLLRDPVDRIRSTTAMYISSFSNKDYSLDNEEKVLRWYYKEKYVEANTRYDLAIENIESIFDKEDIYYGFFEDFFNPAQIKQLCSFLGIDYIEPDLTPFNSYSTNNNIDTSLINEIREYYSGVYEYIYNKFGHRW